MSVKKSKVSLSPVVAERIFIANIVLLSLLLAANFVFVTNILKSQRSDLEKTMASLKAEDEGQKSITATDSYIKNNTDIIEKAHLIVGNNGYTTTGDRTVVDPRTDNATFQEQVIYDLQNYAKQIGTGIDVYTFPAPATTPTTGTTPTASTTTSQPGAATGAKKEATLKLPSSVQETKINITLNNGGAMTYEELLKFLKLIEGNTTRMYISSISLQPDDSSGKISQASMDITIYSRKK